MGIVNGLRTLNSLLAGSLNSATLENALSTGEGRASFEQAIGLRGQATLLASRLTAVSTALGSATARAAIFGSQTAVRAIASNTASRSAVMASSRAVLGEIAAAPIANKALLDYFPWVQNKSNSPGVFYATTFGNSRFVSVGGSTSSSAASSTDGINWQCDVMPAGDYRAVAFGAGRYVAVGSNICATSTDGVTWTVGLISGSYFGVAFNAGTFVAVGNGVAATSTDGVTWTARNIPAGTYNAIAFGAGVFAAVGPAVCATSPTGTTWTSRTIPSNSYTGIAYGASLFVAVSASNIVYSSDGTSWSLATGTLYAATAVAWSGSEFLAVSAAANTSARSTNGTSWTAGTAVSTVPLYSVAFGAGVFAALGGGAIGATSPTGVTFTERKVSSNDLRDVCYSGTQYLAVGISGNVAVSSNGTKWTTRPRPVNTTNTLSFVAFGNGVYVTYSTSDEIFTSTDGITWVTRTAPGSIVSLEFVNGIFLAVGVWANTLYTSRDGITWTTRSIPGSASSPQSVYGNGVYVIGSNDANPNYSYDAITWLSYGWTGVGSPPKGAFGNDLFVFAGSNGVNISRNGINWVNYPAASVGLSSIIPQALEFANEQFYLVDSSGTVFTSETGTFWVAQAAAVTTSNSLTSLATDGTNVVAVTEGGSALVKY